jgi:hypothetical protein
MVVANFLAPGTDRNQASQCTNLCQSSLQLANEALSFSRRSSVRKCHETIQIFLRGTDSHERRATVRMERNTFRRNRWNALASLDAVVAEHRCLTPGIDPRSSPQAVPQRSFQHIFSGPIHERKPEIRIKSLETVRNALYEVRNLGACAYGV